MSASQRKQKQEKKKKRDKKEGIGLWLIAYWAS
jgi:hypothetical protein